ncbi:hypothetical protein [Litchfieldia alkalitelluris]|uniref:hypothetical protein n=1 Tax=Litchfieldia alkalitelluris TaxID=304268 RepID=UPI00099700D5|nr:hypothetical protein [Litchfieldia alkalitelluris]
MLFFVITFLSIVFFFGTFILLYLNLFSDIDKERAKDKKLYKIGITGEEIKKMIASELKVLFFVPTIIGTILAYLYITDVGGIMVNPDLLINFAVISGIYFFIQIGYYIYAKRKMWHLILLENSQR